MAFTDYQDFRVSMFWLIEGQESSPTFSVNAMDLIIGLGEERVYNGDTQTPALRASSMVASLSQAVTSNAASLPSDLLELKEVYFSGEPNLEIVRIDKLRELEASGTSTGDARYCAQDGDTLRFWPEASGTVLGRYYKKPVALETGGLHSTFLRYPQLFTYATLVEAAMFLGMDSRLPNWMGLYRAHAEGAAHAERMRVYGGSPLRIRAR